MKYFISLLLVAGLVIIGWIFYNQNRSIPLQIDNSVDVVTIEMKGDKFRFSPSEIKVKQGQKVKVVLASVDMPHNFYLDEFQVVGPTAQPGQSTTVEFVATKKGEFEYYCAVGQHRAKGMVGTLTVE